MNKNQEKVLLNLSKLKMLNRRQIQEMLGLRVRWTNQLLEPLVEQKLVTYRESVEGRIYKLTKKGCEMYGSKYLWGWGNLNHTLLRNWYIINEFGGWSKNIKIEADIQLDGSSYGICDASIQKDELFILEVDRFQKWKANITKMERYKDLKNEGIDFTLVWIVEMESRVPKIEKKCRDLKLSYEVYSKDDVK